MKEFRSDILGCHISRVFIYIYVYVCVLCVLIMYSSKIFNLRENIFLEFDLKLIE